MAQNDDTVGVVKYSVLGDVYVVDNDLHKKEFENAVSRLIQMTYRTRFEPIVKDDDGPSPLNIKNLLRDNFYNSIENLLFNSHCFTSDIGWGCMIRTGQTLLANALQRTNKGTPCSEIIELFVDETKNPFSIHNFITVGKDLNLVKVGEWFSPSITIQIIEKLIENNNDHGIKKCIVSISSGDIYEQDVLDELDDSEPPANTKQQHILLLFGIKLGINTINIEKYGQDIKDITNNKYTCGISGGQPKSSLFFFGYNNTHDRILYFDPHKPNNFTTDNDYSTYHSTEFNELEMFNLDPSMIIGFLVKNNKADWNKFKSTIKHSNIIKVLSGKRTDADSSSYKITKCTSIEDDEEYIIV
ncbi:hypothetical protein TPHA_0P01710 [Tetrapisispora phaffii CBS 4417]|uniref:Cysteine protease n=1 Tax=Tetrapisispora phaffii (strain ATCC 24235 / CBS 4417 / NBRC 1672 / NRRL Y-8282 / UCD 70-5) TaxID=1071381 RepID=G8C2F1_TETPH|nr:hypothetical protein TPHA_0P01710 [Tetrapisispora phaffii CBS 4417]CCE66329.1 hypothetical protein TPHA_0P01710 [Tetrapisispora phaffii CBS 4417]